MGHLYTSKAKNISIDIYIYKCGKVSLRGYWTIPINHKIWTINMIIINKRSQKSYNSSDTSWCLRHSGFESLLSNYQIKKKKKKKKGGHHSLLTYYY